MKVLGVDIGFASMGIAVGTMSREGKVEINLLGVLRTEKENKKVQLRSSEDNIKRAQVLYSGLSQVISQNNIGIITTESMSWPRNAGVVAKMGIAWGVLAAVASQCSLPMVQSSPVEIKKRVCGDGKASKEMIISEIKLHHPNLEWHKQETMWEHCADAAASIIAARDTELMKWVRSL